MSAHRLGTLGQDIMARRNKGAESCVGLAGPSLRFHVDTVAALTGADFDAEVDGSAVPLWTSVLVKAGSVLTVGKVGVTMPPTRSLLLRMHCITLLKLRLFRAGQSKLELMAARALTEQ